MDASYKHPVVAVVGPTATGKTALGVELAKHFSGEVISCDSMQIYKGLDIGTAKVTPEETCGIPHHGVDILTPDKAFSVADFTAMAGKLEEEISARKKLPILVGGTGLYVQSFLYGVRFTEEKAPAGLREQLAAELAAKGGAAMYEELKQADPEAAAAIHPNNQVLHSPLGVLFTFPSRYCSTIGHQVVFRLGRWSSLVPTGFHVSGGTLDTVSSVPLSPTGLSPSVDGLPMPFG